MTRTLLRGVERAILAHVNSGSRGCPREPPSCPPSKENASAELRQSQQAGPEPVAPGDTGGETPGRRSPADQLLLPGGDRGLPSCALDQGGNGNGTAGPRNRSVADCPLDRLESGRGRASGASLPSASRLRVRALRGKCPRPAAQGRSVHHVPRTATPNSPAPQPRRSHHAAGCARGRGASGPREQGLEAAGLAHPARPLLSPVRGGGRRRSAE